jgi:hypothetical protein
MALRKFVIERDIPAVGTLQRDQLRQAAAKSNDALRQLGPDIQWNESYVRNSPSPKRCHPKKSVVILSAAKDLALDLPSIY